MPKAWACLGDEGCRTALKCLPQLAEKCGEDVIKVVTDPVEREKVMCLQECKGDKICVLTKCGKDAVDCLIGTEAVCHAAIVCVPEVLASCSKDASGCIFSKDGICHDNMMCLAQGVNTCADPAVNVLTDISIGNLVVCANQKCPAVTPMVETAEQLLDVAVSLPHYQEQLACLGLHCAGKVLDLMKGRDVAALTKSLPQAVEECSPDVWQCVSEHKCLSDFRCWTAGLAGATQDLWTMLTNDAERTFDQGLVQCIEACEQKTSPISRAACLVGQCGVKGTKCLADSTCRKLLEDLPAIAVKCGPESVKELKDKNSSFSKAVRCGLTVAERCGSDAVELLRGASLAGVVQCNVQCTRVPGQASSGMLVIV